MRRSAQTRWFTGLALLAALAVAGPAAACPFCPSADQTLTKDAAQAMLIVFGTLTNPQYDPAQPLQGTTDLKVELVVKPHAYLGDKKVLTLNRYIPVDKENKGKYLVFCDVFNGKLDAYRGVLLRADSQIGDYLKGALELKDKDLATRLNYFFKYLDSPDIDIANDAFAEFAMADYKDYRPLAEKLSADKIVKWLKDENTPASRFGLYGSILGHCGKPEHAAVLRDMLDNQTQRFASGIDGVLAGYVMLQKKDGWDYVRGILKDGSKEFLLRYAALRTARFFWDYRPDVVEHQQIADAVASLLAQDDIADLAIEDLRKWKQWSMADQVLGLFDRKGFDAPIIKRAILRFALACPPKESAKSAEFVAKTRKQAPDWVKDVEELLQLETDAKPAAPATATAPKSGKPLTK